MAFSIVITRQIYVYTFNVSTLKNAKGLEYICAVTRAEVHYRERTGVLKKEIDQLRKRIRLLVALRVTLFLVFGIGIWGLANWDSNGLWGITTLLGITGFMFSLKEHGQRKVQLDISQRRKQIVESELKSLRGDFSFPNDGKEFQHAAHEYTHDLDVFGPRSLFHAISRAGLDSSRKRLADWLSNSSAIQESVIRRQQAIAELCEKTELREEIQAQTSLAFDGQLNESKLIAWCRSELQNAPGKGAKLLIYLVPIFQTINIGLYATDVTRESMFIFLLLIPVAISLSRMNRTKEDYSELDTQYKELSKVTSAINRLKSQEWHSVELNESKVDLESGGEALAGLQKILSRFDDRNNFIVAALGNILFTWDLWCSASLHEWHTTHSKEVEQSLEALFDFEALSSFASFNYNFQENLILPKLDAQAGVSAQNLRHPLMKFEACVANGIDIENAEIKIVTGANMSGKSTFLRTVGLNFVLAMNGSKVFAERFVFKPTTLFTSMRTSDSLQDQESYFFNELKRLHVLVEKLEKGEPPFILLDEILKGTNSKDKAEGSYKFVEKLLTFDATAIIATHDLSLCALSDHYAHRVENLFFDVEIKEDDLAFDYQIRKGVCSNMNATFLMRKMGITD